MTETPTQRPKIRPNLMVDNVRDAADYYTTLFDFSVVCRVAEEFEMLEEDDATKTLIFVILTMPCGTELFLQQRESFADDIPSVDAQMPLGGSMAIYIEVDDVDAMYDAIEKDGRSTMLFAPKDQWYGMRECCFRDASNYIITLGKMLQSPQQ